MNKRKNGEEIEITRKKKKNISNYNAYKISNTKKTKKLVAKKKKGKTLKKDKTSKLFVQNITLDLKNNPIKRSYRIYKKQNHNVLTSINYINIRNNFFTFDQINIRFSEKQIYEMAIKINKYK